MNSNKETAKAQKERNKALKEVSSSIVEVADTTADAAEIVRGSIRTLQSILDDLPLSSEERGRYEEAIGELEDIRATLVQTSDECWGVELPDIG